MAMGFQGHPEMPVTTNTGGLRFSANHSKILRLFPKKDLITLFLQPSADSPKGLVHRKGVIKPGGSRNQRNTSSLHQ
jgi:hypothetical protein